MHLQPLPALSDNYIWTLCDARGRGLMVDPGEAAPVFDWAQGGRRPTAILLTHHHPDHIGGVPELLRRWPDLEVHAPADARIDSATHRVGDGDRVRVLGCTFEVIATPGHTRSHVVFHGHGLLFSGDTLFSLGCGRLLEGTPAQMLASLDRLAALPGTTRLCCGHEYTLANAAFALAVEPDNAALRRHHEDIQAMRARGEPSLPSTLGDEAVCNPFLRIDAPTLRAALSARIDTAQTNDRTTLFAALRRWKDDFRA